MRTPFTLDDHDAYDDRPWSRPNLRGGSQSVPSDALPLGGGGCWCGEPYPHDWPGKNEGAPHPR